MPCFLSEVVPSEYDSAALHHFLRAAMHLTRREISRAKFLQGGICVDGVPCKVTAQVRTGQRVTVRTESGEKTSAHLKAVEAPLSILYEDADLLVVDKPSGIPVHPSGRRTFASDTLANRLAYYLGEKGEAGVIRIIGRLDKDTSGVVLAAKNRTAAARLMRQRESGVLHKTYLALTDGVPEPESGTICKPLKADPADKTRMQVCDSDADPTENTEKEGKYAETHYRTVEKWESKNAALVELRLETGRTHQIRVHMQNIGCPLLGDSLYGKRARADQKDTEETGTENRTAQQEPETNGPAARIKRTALHAVTLDFIHPFTGIPIRVEAPLPKDIARYITDVLK